MIPITNLLTRIAVGVALISVGCLLAGSTAAQAQTLSGRVLDETRHPLADANVFVEALGRGAATDKAGRFQLDDLEPGVYEVVVRFVGYRPEAHTVTLDEGETATLVVEMTPVQLEVDELIVEAGKEAALLKGTRSTAVLDPQDLDRLRGQTLGETLKQLPGVATLQTGPSIVKPVIRGLHSQRVVILNAGVRQEGQQWGGEHAPEIDPFAPAQVEVIKGAAGVEYGVGAIGGVVRLEPRALPTTPGLGGEITANGFTNNAQGAASGFVEGGVPGADGWGWRVQSSVRKAASARTPDYVIGNSGFEEFDASAALGYRADHYRVEGYYSRFSTELGIFTGAHINTVDGLQAAIERGRPAVTYDFTYDIDAPKQSITHNLFSLEGTYELPSGGQINAQYGYQRNHRQEFDAHSPGGGPPDGPAFDLTLNTHTLDVKWRSRPIENVWGGDFLGVAGVSGMNQGNVNAEAGYLIPNFRALTSGTFVRGTWMRGEWTLEAGSRFDYRWMRAYPREFGGRGDFREQVDTFAGISNVVGAIWQFAPAWSLAANVSTAWRPPSVNEQYSRGVHHGTAQFEIGEPQLDAERTQGIDATLRHQAERARMEVSAYNNRIQDFIHLFPTQEPVVTIRGVFPAFRYRQADVVLRGFDGWGEIDLNRTFTLGASVSVVRGTNTDADIPLIDMPADRVTTTGTVHLPNWSFIHQSAIEVQGTFVRKQTRVPDGVDYAPPPDGYAVFGLRFDTEVHRGATPVYLSVAVENLFNTAYRDYLNRFRYFIDEPGRSLVLRLRIPFDATS